MYLSIRSRIRSIICSHASAVASAPICDGQIFHRSAYPLQMGADSREQMQSNMLDLLVLIFLL